jgi:glucosamine-phosphate N-acetyltransferase
MEIRKIKEADFLPGSGFFETLSNLSPTPEVDHQEAIRLWKEIRRYTIIYVAIDNNQIIGTIRLLLELKFYRGLSIAGHIEDVITRKGFENLGVASQLIKEIIEEAKRHDCYKLILDCHEDLERFYNRFGFSKSDSCLRLDLR